MTREIEYINYSEDERLAMLENRAAELERMLGRVAAHPVSGHTAARRDTGRHTRGERGAGRTGRERAEAEDGAAGAGQTGYVRSGASPGGDPGDGYGAPGIGGSSHGAPGYRASGSGEQGAAGYGAAADGEAAPDGVTYRRAGGDGRARDAHRDAGRRARDAHRDAGRPGARGGYRDWVPGQHASDGGYDEARSGYDEARSGYDEARSGYDGPDQDYADPDDGHADPEADYAGAGVYHVAGPPGYGAGFAEAETADYGGFTAAQEQDERTEVLINHGRRRARPTGLRRWARHWRAILIGAAGLTAGVLGLAIILPGASATWPASVARVQREIAVACENPNVVSEPSQVNFACAKNTRQILWVFSLLTSGDNAHFSDPANGRKGLEPITPAQGGSVAWSLNLHHPYNPANPTDSLEVAARAINNIVGGATLTGSNGTPTVQPGLESDPANCARYTGSSALVTRQGFPAECAQPVTSPGGQAALVSDVFQQWMVGTPSRIAAEAGVLFSNADNPGDPRVQAILNSLPRSGM